MAISFPLTGKNYHSSLDGIYMPEAIKQLPVCPVRQVPVPWFVSWVGDKPEFRVADGRKIVLAIEQKRCWVCGKKLSQQFAFLIGPMCCINRISAEPPSHLECATFSVKACPFLTRPHMDRREGGIPDEAIEPAGVMIRRNPGVTCLWVCRNYKVVKAPDGGRLISIGGAEYTRWYAEGRQATRAEILESIKTGLPTLEQMAGQQGREALLKLEQLTKEAIRLYLPKE